MKNIAYFFWTGAVNEMFLNCIQSYRDLDYFDEWYILTDNNSILDHYSDFQIIQVPDDWSTKRFYLKISSVRHIKANDGDRIMILDGDTLCRKNIENFFTPGADLILTTRHYEAPFKINAGVWGFIKNANTDLFLQHASETILNPLNWSAYYQLKMNHPWTNARSLTNIDWPVDQDYLEMIYKHRQSLSDEISINLNVHVHENGIYNCIVSTINDDIISEIDPYIIHYKNQSGDKWRAETKRNV
jgi:hypothetical protein